MKLQAHETMETHMNDYPAHDTYRDPYQILTSILNAERCGCDRRVLALTDRLGDVLDSAVWSAE